MVDQESRVMKKVLFISKRTRVADFSLFPIFRNKALLKKRGYNTSIKYSLENIKNGSEINYTEDFVSKLHLSFLMIKLCFFV
jgi:hypothetical protein